MRKRDTMRVSASDMDICVFLFQETIYAGVEGGSETPVGIGPLCEFVTTDGADKATESESFEVV